MSPDPTPQASPAPPHATGAPAPARAELPHRTLGRSGLRLPEVALGLWQNFGVADPFSTQREIVLHAVDRVLERDAPRPLDVEASITAKPFFERHGYRAVARQTVTRRGIELTNYRMVKRG